MRASPSSRHVEKSLSIRSNLALLLCAVSAIASCTSSRKPFSDKCDMDAEDICNGLDDDCDGRVDESDGEVCNGIDDDCDGNSDEGRDLPDDLNNCGECGNVCELTNADAVCAEGVCRPQRCLQGFSDVDERPENGCEHVCTEYETCNEIDDDCDGTVDEGAAGESCEPPIVQLAAGGEHTCALRQDHHVFCWGNGTWGQLGHGRDTESLIPVEVVNLDDAVLVGAGGLHACAMRENGVLVCWGNNVWGQIGVIRDGMSDNIPVEIPLETITTFGAGSYHNCAVDEDGDVWCWGWNGEGQLGRRVRPEEDYERSPARVPGIGDVKQIDGGNAFTCALLDDSTVSCWGSNRIGQLGDGTLTSRIQPGPVRAPNGTAIEDVISLALGPYHACALQDADHDSEGTVLCWGDDVIAAPGGSPSAPPVVNPTGIDITDALEIAPGVYSACARRANGTVSCWGMNDQGQLGNGTSDPMSSLRPVTVDGVLNATGLFVDHGGYQACALRDDYSVVCWGSNEHGQLGNGRKSVEPNSVPVRVRGI